MCQWGKFCKYFIQFNLNIFLEGKAWAEWKARDRIFQLDKLLLCPMRKYLLGNRNLLDISLLWHQLYLINRIHIHLDMYCNQSNRISLDHLNMFLQDIWFLLHFHQCNIEPMDIFHLVKKLKVLLILILICNSILWEPSRIFPKPMPSIVFEPATKA